MALRDLDLPTSELSNLYGLRRLRTLYLDHCFASCLDDATIAALVPPTPVLPALTLLFYQELDDQRCDYVKQQGSSFEWMQQRRTR